MGKWAAFAVGGEASVLGEGHTVAAPLAHM